MAFFRLVGRIALSVYFAVPAALFLFFWGPLITQAAFGISPPFLNADHLVPGVAYKQTIYLVQDQAADDIGIKVTLKIPEEINGWFHIDPGLDFVIPKGTRQFPVNVTVNVPKSAGLGKYSGNITFVTVPAPTGGQVAIALGANVVANLTVGDGVYESYKIPFITLPDIEEGWNPRAAVRFQNDGNVPEKFDRAVFDLYDRFDSVRLAYMTKEDGFPQTPPFTTKEYTIEFESDFHLGVGEYWGSVNFYKNDQVIASTRTIFHVLPSGSLSPFSKIVASIKNNIAYVVAGIILLAFIVWRLMQKRHRRRSA